MDWKKIKAEYIAGGTSYRKLAEKYKVSQSTLRKVAAKEQWTELRNKTRTKADSKIAEALSDKEAHKAVDIVDVADRLLGKIKEVLGGVTTTQDIRHLTSALKDLREIKGIKSEADIREQEARIAKLQRDVAANQDDDKPSGVVLLPSVADKLEPPSEEDDDG